MGDYVLPWWFWSVEVMGIVGVLGFGWEGAVDECTGGRGDLGEGSGRGVEDGRKWALRVWKY